MIAVCDVGPPAAVQKPTTRAGSMAAVSDGVRSSAIEHDRVTGELGVGVVDAGEEGQHPVADVAEVGRPCRQQWVVDLLEMCVERERTCDAATSAFFSMKLSAPIAAARIA